MSDIRDAARAARAAADEVISRHRNGSHSKLREVLANCLSLCERCNRDPAERAVLDELFKDEAGPRKWVERESDVYLRVCRFVFDRDATRSTSWRYANALRGAADHQVRSEAFAEWCEKHGGVSGISRQKFDEGQTRTSILRLDRLITVPRGREFTLRLRKASTQYEVIAVGDQR